MPMCRGDPARGLGVVATWRQGERMQAPLPVRQQPDTSGPAVLVRAHGWSQMAVAPCCCRLCFHGSQVLRPTHELLQHDGLRHALGLAELDHRGPGSVPSGDIHSAEGERMGLGVAFPGCVAASATGPRGLPRVLLMVSGAGVPIFSCLLVPRGRNFLPGLVRRMLCSVR